MRVAFTGHRPEQLNIQQDELSQAGQGRGETQGGGSRAARQRIPSETGRDFLGHPKEVAIWRAFREQRAFHGVGGQGDCGGRADICFEGWDDTRGTGLNRAPVFLLIKKVALINRLPRSSNPLRKFQKPQFAVAVFYCNNGMPSVII